MNNEGARPARQARYMVQMPSESWLALEDMSKATISPVANNQYCTVQYEWNL